MWMPVQATSAGHLQAHHNPDGGLKPVPPGRGLFCGSNFHGQSSQSFQNRALAMGQGDDQVNGASGLLDGLKDAVLHRLEGPIPPPEGAHGAVRRPTPEVDPPDPPREGHGKEPPAAMGQFLRGPILPRGFKDPDQGPSQINGPVKIIHPGGVPRCAFSYKKVRPRRTVEGRLSPGRRLKGDEVRGPVSGPHTRPRPRWSVPSRPRARPAGPRWPCRTS